MRKINLFVPKFRIDECLVEIEECLKKGWSGMGFKTIEFEEAWKKYTSLNYAYFLNSATAGLDLAVNILKETNSWKDEDEIISTPMTFVSTNHAILYNKLKPIFADVDEYLCLDPNSVKKLINSKTKAIMFVGLGGNTGRLSDIAHICKEKGLKLILDAAHMGGTRYKNGSFPGKDFADVIIYSFQAVKNLPTGDSGMICFRDQKNDEIVRKKAWLGINKDTYVRSNDDGIYKWKYEVEYLGYKYNGNSIMASLGLVSLKYLDQDNAYRRQMANWYDMFFKDCSNIKSVKMADDCESSRHLYQILVNNRDELIVNLNSVGIFPGVHYLDNTKYRMYSYAKGTCPNSRYYSDHVLSLPLHVNLSYDDIRYISEMVKKYVK